jgi:hypothetical protein
VEIVKKKMNPGFFKIGDKVKFIGASDDQVNWGSNDDPRLLLNTKTVYEIESVEIHHWYTKIKLAGIKGWFNSVHFGFAKTNYTSRGKSDSVHHHNNIRKKSGTEFLKEPSEFIRFLREDDEELVGFGKTTLVAAGEDVINSLIELLINEKEDEKVRRRAGNVLSRIGKPAIIPLLEVLKKQNWENKSSAKTVGMTAAALGGIGKSAIEPLILALDSELRQVRYGAAIALVQTGESEAIDAVRNAAIHGDPKDHKMFEMVLNSQ